MISLRKINSLLIVIVILVLVNHAMLNILGMYGLISYTPDFKITGRRLFYPLVAHIIISLAIPTKQQQFQSADNIRLTKSELHNI